MKWALLGASSGLGAAFHRLILMSHPDHQILSISRKAQDGERTKAWRADFSKEDQWPRILDEIKNFQPDWIIYFSGGGPYGRFDEKNFRDHQWAFKVNFEFPAYVLHQVMQTQFKEAATVSSLNSKPLEGVKNSLLSTNLCFIGSSIAESSADPMAASYAAGKHALKGLVDSVKAEIPREGLNFRLELFSPGYMSTPMLPANSWPRLQGLAQEPAMVAKELLKTLS